MARFRAEARHAGSLSHPGIAQVYDYAETDPASPPFLVMELVDGPSLAGLLDGGPLTPADAMDVLAQVAAGLAAGRRHHPATHPAAAARHPTAAASTPAVRTVTVDAAVLIGRPAGWPASSWPSSACARTWSARSPGGSRPARCWPSGPLGRSRWAAWSRRPPPPWRW